jgi:O-antigen ligase/polysaccharide polymerase Wzy-like membrane protein
MATATVRLEELSVRPGWIHRFWVATLCLALLGYALLGKSFAYLGSPPIFVSEAILLAGVLSLLIGWRVLLRSGLLRWAMLPMYLFMIWGATRTAPYWDEYGMDALRDGALWRYGVFAIVIYGLVAKDGWLLRSLVCRYRWFARIYPFAALLVLLIQILHLTMPNVPGTQVPAVSTKTGDVAVHIAGVTAFTLVGLAELKSYAWFLSLFATVVVCASGNRGAAVSYLCAVIFVLVLSGRARAVIARLVLPLALLLSAGFFLNPEIELHQAREISLRQLAVNYASVVASFEDNPGNSESTKQWRLMWWTRIVDYTVFGDYFWDGKGFGVNLTKSDGFTSRSGLLRSPHNVHMTVLARSGVIGLSLWGLFQVAWLVTVLRSLFRARRHGHAEWEALFVFLGSYWVASVVNASFDVYLEGPMGGVWFWVLTGLGLAAAQYYQNHTAQQSHLEPAPTEQPLPA